MKKLLEIFLDILMLFLVWVGSTFLVAIFGRL